MTSLPPDPHLTTKSTRTPLSRPISGGIRTVALYGPQGLRAGWKALLFIGVLFSLLFLSTVEIRSIASRMGQNGAIITGGEIHPALLIVGEAATLIAVLLATMAMARLEQHRAADYGLTGTHRLRQFVIGLVSGFGFLSFLIAILITTHHLTLHATHSSVAYKFHYAGAWGVCFLLVGFTEELMFRGYLLFTLDRGIGFWPAAVLLAALFGLMHRGNHGESPFGLIAAALVALVFSLSLWRLGHLWWAIGFHAAWDWAQSFFYGTPDSGTVSVGRLMEAHPLGPSTWSGGSTGPEGSVWIIPVLALLAAFVWFSQPKQTSHFH